MAGIVYMKSNSKVSLTGPEYTGLSIPSGAKTLYVQTGNATSDRVKYGLTTDVSASAYSPVINVSGTTMYIASGGTVTETVTTNTVYHTATRASTSNTVTIYDTYTQKKSVYANRTYYGNADIVTIHTSGYSISSVYWKMGTYGGNKSGYLGTFTGVLPANTSAFISLVGSGVVSSSRTRLWVLSSKSLITHAQSESLYTCAVASSGVNYSYDRYYLKLSNGAYSYVATVTVPGSSHEDYATRSSTYTSRTEYLTSSRTYITNNIAA